MSYCYILKGINPCISNKINIDDITNEENKLESLLKAGEIHKKTRRNIQHLLQPGLKLSLLEKNITDLIKKYTKNNGINGGVAFPPSLSISNCIGHYTPYKNIDRTLNYTDNLKLDIGVHVNGWIIDSAFTVYFNNELDNLHLAAKEATNYGCKNIGIDVFINDWANDINEIISSYEINYKKKLYTIKNIKNIGGHNILQNTIHGGEFIPSYKTSRNNGKRFKEGIYAIEPFCSIISDKITFNHDEITNYKYNLSDPSNDIEKNIFSKFNNFIFTRKHVDNFNIKNFNLIKNKLSNYPPLYSTNSDDFSAQYEHTVYIDNNKKIVLSQSNDY